ncbi:MAG: HAD-IA family hydrolase [Clostridiales bacterium]|uniref:HAD family hydrolase n=1 Tax=Flavonifractor porci TaxID=3133422 RepID=UPI0030AE1E7E|nr:HAD-IA family hydrolase [Clostridiales bacterium]
MGFQGVFFDFDYTLGDATEAIVAGFRYGFTQMGLPEPEREAVRHTIGMTLEDGYTTLTGDNRPEQRALFRQLYTEKAAPLQVQVTKLFPGAAELLSALKEASIPAGVVSTKRTDTLTAVLEARGVRQYLVSLTGGDKVDRPKPDPQGLLSALAELGLKPENVLYCGDTLIDAETAHRAGTHFCAVLNGTTTRQNFESSGLPMDHVAADLGDLKAWLGL